MPSRYNIGTVISRHPSRSAAALSWPARVLKTSRSLASGADGLPPAVEEPLHKRVAQHRRSIGEADLEALFEAARDGEPAVNEEVRDRVLRVPVFLFATQRVTGWLQPRLAEDRIQQGIKFTEVAVHVRGENEARVGLCDASALQQRRPGVPEIVDADIGDHQIEVCVWERHCCGVGLDDVDGGQAVMLKLSPRARKRIGPDVDADEV